MHDAIYDYRSVFNFEKYPVVADAQTVFWREIGEPLDVASKPSLQLTKLGSNSSRILFL